MEMSVIGVVGAGVMGSGIAQVAAAAGFKVLLADMDESFVRKGLQRIHQHLDGQVAKGRITAEQAQAVKDNLTAVSDLEALAGANAVIEVVTEKLEIKQQLFKRLDGIVPREALLATNTSGLSITAIAAGTSRPERVVGLHFFNPPPVMKLVEVVKGIETSRETLDRAHTLAKAFGKETIECVDHPLFVVNRILVPMINEAIFVLQEGIATKEEIDKGLVLGANHPIGPIALTDMIGLDTLLFVAETLHQETGEDKYRPAPLLRKMVRAGLLGRKTGRGFYDYSNK